MFQRGWGGTALGETTANPDRSASAEKPEYGSMNRPLRPAPWSATTSGIRTWARRPGGRWSTAARASPPDVTVNDVLPAVGGRLHGLAAGPGTGGALGRGAGPAPAVSSASAMASAPTGMRDRPRWSVRRIVGPS